MTARTISGSNHKTQLSFAQWAQIGLAAAVASILAVLVVQAALLALWPELSSFKPLESYPRSALFTLIPAIGATAVFAWLAQKQPRPVEKFIWISAVVLLVSFIPDYVLPVPNRTLASSSAAAFLHLIAGIVTVGVIVGGYNRPKPASRGR